MSAPKLERFSLLEPYAPLNEFIQSEQAAGRLLFDDVPNPWPDTATAHEAVRALVNHRAGYSEFPKKLQSFAREISRSSDTLRIKSFTAEKMQVAIEIWKQSQYRKKRHYYATSDSRLDLDAPYAPINHFILDELKCGKLKHLGQWNENKPLREAILALRKHLLGHKKIRKFLDGQPDILKTFNGITAKQIESDIMQAPYNRKSIRKSIVDAALEAWKISPDRDKPIEYTRSFGRMIPENEIVPALNAVIAWMDQHDILDQPYTTPIAKLTLREAVEILCNEFKPWNFAWELSRDAVIPQWLPVQADDFLPQITQGWFLQNGDEERAFALANKQVISSSKLLSRLKNFSIGPIKTIREADVVWIADIYQNLAHGKVREQRGVEPYPRPIAVRRRSSSGTARDANAIENDPHYVLVQKAYYYLPDKLRDVIHMRYAKSYTLEECAQLIECTRENVRQIELKAMNELRKICGVQP